MDDDENREKGATAEVFPLGKRSREMLSTLLPFSSFFPHKKKDPIGS